MRRRALLLIAVMAAAILLAGGTALAVDKVCPGGPTPSQAFCSGTTGNDLLIGTKDGDLIGSQTGNDLIIGNEGNDILNGAGGSDTYSFKDGFGQDTLEDTAGSSTDRDTVDFSKVTSAVTIFAVPERASNDPIWSQATAGTNKVQFCCGTTIEKIVGSVGNSTMGGGKQNNTYVINGPSDDVHDFGGSTAPTPLPVSNDTYIYKSGSVQIMDDGGSGDVLDLKPRKVTDTHFEKGSSSDPNDLVLTLGPTSSDKITVSGYFTTSHKIEKIVFADRTITSISLSS